MRYIKASNKNVREVLSTALSNKEEWIVCVTAEDSDDFSTYVLENVTRYEVEGHFASLMQHPVFIEYGISPAKNGALYPYRLHDFLMTPVTNEQMLAGLVDTMIETFDVFIVEEDLVDRCNVYGKLSTDHAEEIVFINKFE